jgi:hypothetical protein
MRCVKCGWIIEDNSCPCSKGRPTGMKSLVPIGTRVAFRYGRGPSMPFWSTGEVSGQQGRLYQVKTRHDAFWCELDDLVPESADRDDLLREGTRVWALWIDGRWFPGIIDAEEGRIRHVIWDDGDAMWLEPHQIVVMAAESGVPKEGTVVLTRHPDGDMQPARVEAREGMRFRVTFRDGEEKWVPGDDITTFPPNPFDFQS